MKQITSILCTCLLFSFILMTSFTKEGAQGSTGPAGPAGPAGAAGAAGTAGAAGAKGDTGAANVIYSAWLDATFGVDAGSLPDSFWIATINAPKLTAAIINTGEIKVYWNLGTPASPTVVPLPYFDGGVIVQPYFSTGSIELDANFNISTVTTAQGKRFQYRYILIPGVVNARTDASAKPDVDWKDYKSVQKYLGLKD